MDLIPCVRQAFGIINLPESRKCTSMLDGIQRKIIQQETRVPSLPLRDLFHDIEHLHSSEKIVWHLMSFSYSLFNSRDCSTIRMVKLFSVRSFRFLSSEALPNLLKPLDFKKDSPIEHQKGAWTMGTIDHGIK